jgi:nucleoside-diphosphate-sugar epimerase
MGAIANRVHEVSNEMTHALVTGGTGFIGRHVAEALRAAGHEVTCLVRPTSDARALTALGARLAYGDLSDAASLARALAGVTVVYHLASLLKVPWKPEFRTVNIEGTRALAEAAAAQASPPALVIVSSLAAAGPSSPGRARIEDDPPQPVSRYGRMKLDAERAAASYAARVPITIVRPPMVFGEGDRWALALFRTAARGVHFVPTWSDHQVSLIHAADLARALLEAGERGERLAAAPDPDGPRGRGVYYIAADLRPTYAELGRTVALASGLRPPRILRVPRLISGAFALASELYARLRDTPTILNLDKWREGTAGSWICDAAKARAGLGFAPRPIEARLAETAAWYRAAGWL